jgi:hypothetical protein
VVIDGKDIDVPNPVNPLHYVQYKRSICEDYKQVRSSLEKAYAHNEPYYLIDEDTEMENKKTLSNLRDKAFGKFLDIKEDDSKWDNILLVLGENPDRLEQLEKIDKLRDFATGVKAVSTREKEEAYQKFINATDDENVEARGLVKELISKEIFKIEGTTIIYNNDTTSIPLGSEDEAVEWVLDKKNSKDIVSIKARLSDKKKAK